MTDQIKAEIIIAEVCRFLKLNPDKLTSTPNIIKYTEARYYIFHFCRCKTKLSAIEIAIIFRMDRANIYQAMRIIRERMIFRCEREKTLAIEKLIDRAIAEKDCIKYMELQAVAMCQF
jgi:chromosomal replication initiation ATPase DnaA